MRLTGKLVFAALVSLVLVEMAWLAGAYLHRAAHIDETVDRETRTLLSAAVDPGVFPTLSNEKAVISRLRDIAHIVGARFEDTAGEPLGVIGQPPDITVLEAKRDSITNRLSRGRDYLDIFVPAPALQFSHPMVVRVDLAPYYRRIKISVLDDAFTVINIVVLTMAGLFIALYPILLAPIARIRKAIVHGVNDLDIADSFAIRWSRRDELDDLARAVNELLFTASKNYEEILHTAQDILTATSVASLAYTPDGTLKYANPAALALFDAESLEDLATRDQNIVKLADDEDGAARSFPEIARDTPMSDEARIVTPRGERLMLCLAGNIYRADGSLRRHTAQFLDLEQAMVRMAKLARMSEHSSLRRIAADRRSLRLRVMLESCFTLLDVSGETQDYGMVDPEEIIVGWAKAYAAAGKARKVLYNRLPPLTGNGGRLAILIRQMLSYAEFSSAYVDSGFKLIAHEANGMVQFELTEEAGANALYKSGDDKAGESELTLCRGAITRIAESIDGTFTETPAPDGDVGYSLTIPAVAIAKDAPRAA